MITLGFLRTDTEFILRFLRARKYKPQEAFEVFLNYYHFMHRNHSFYAGYNVNNPEVKCIIGSNFSVQNDSISFSCSLTIF